MLRSLEPPKLSEGFVDVCSIHFVPHFATPDEEEKFFHWRE